MSIAKKIRFDHVGRNEGCICDKCGQYIQNVWSVQYTPEITLHYGIDCFANIIKKSNLTKEGQKLMRKAMKSLEDVKACFERELEKTEETDLAYQTAQADWNKQDYWNGKPWEEYHKWMVEEFWPYRIQRAEKELDKYGKANFN